MASIYTSNYTTSAYSIPENFTPNADLNKAVWQDVPKLKLEHFRKPKSYIPRIDTQVAIVYTPSHFYLAYWCQYFEINHFKSENLDVEFWQLWDKDVVEVFINPFPEQINTYFEFEVAPNNQWIDLAINLDNEPVLNVNWDSGFTHATRIYTKTWVCEMSIPVKSMGLKQIDPGMNWRINFYRCDGIGNVDQRRLLAWSPTLDNSFHIPQRFGTIHFQK